MLKKRRILSVILAILMVISIVPITANAESITGTCGDNLTWTYNTTSYTLTISGTGDMYDYKTNNRPWESYEDNIKKIIVEDGVTTIGNYAFYHCEKLINVTLPDCVTSIGEYAFRYCDSIVSLTLPDDLITIGDNSFAVCESLANITIPYGVTTIGNDAFRSCVSLTNITIPATVTLIGDEAFQCCENLTDIVVDNENQYYSSDEYGVLFNKNQTTLIICPDGNKESFYRVPDSVLTIEAWAFRYCYNLEQVIIPDSVKTIGDHAFYLCSNLVDVKIGNGVTEISDWMFGECVSLETFTIPDNITRIGEYAFYWCDNITSVIIGKNLTSICYSAFEGCTNITDVYYSDTKNKWESIAIDDYNDGLINATIHYNSTGPHIHDYKADVISSTCTEQGYTTYTCECGDTYVDDYVDALGHSYSSEITTPATHTTTGLMTYTCTCGDSYTEIIEKTGHNYEAVVTPPTCTEQGYTTYTCECGDSYIADYVDATAHSHTSEITTPATHTTTGVITHTCICGDTYTEVIEKITEHDYETVVTDPTCTEQGYTTYTCACGDSYIDDYIDSLGHDMIIDEAVTPDCMNTGLTEGSHCSRCDGATTEQGIIPALGHSHDTTVTLPTCTEQGYTAYTCECGDSYIADYVDATGHSYVDNVCTGCEDTIILNGWQLEDGKWAYYVNNEKLTNKWIKDSVDWCYLGADGYCVTNTWKADSKGWCYIGSDCRIIYNQWLYDNGKWYFIDANGYMVSNKWMKDSKDWVYLGSNGAMLTNAWAKDSIGWCYVGNDGYWVKNQWIEYNNNWYYINANGYMVTGTKKINGKTYKFSSNGVWIS